MANDDVHLSAAEVARLLRMTPTSVRNWVRSGRLAAVNGTTASAGQNRGLRFRARDVRRLLDAEQRRACGRRLPQVAVDQQAHAALAIAGGRR